MRELKTYVEQKSSKDFLRVKPVFFAEGKDAELVLNYAFVSESGGPPQVRETYTAEIQSYRNQTRLKLDENDSRDFFISPRLYQGSISFDLFLKGSTPIVRVRISREGSGKYVWDGIISASLTAPLD